jgi:hypothetical protein
MNRNTLWVVLILLSCAAMLLVLTTAIRSHAQCAFDAPAKAKAIKSSLVRAYASCPGVTFPSPNTSTMAGVPGCAPPTPSSPYELDDAKGSCTVTLKHSVAIPCGDGSETGCSTLRFGLKCAGLEGPGGGELVDTAGWSLGVVFRGTVSSEPGDEDVTALDFPLQLPLPEVKNGTLKAKIDVGGCGSPLICALFELYVAPCAQLEILSLTLRDPDGNAFATLGSSGR